MGRASLTGRDRAIGSADSLFGDVEGSSFGGTACGDLIANADGLSCDDWDRGILGTTLYGRKTAPGKADGDSEAFGRRISPGCCCCCCCCAGGCLALRCCAGGAGGFEAISLSSSSSSMTMTTGGFFEAFAGA